MSTNKSKCKNEGKKRNDDMVLMWLNWSIATINDMLQLLDIYIDLLEASTHIDDDSKTQIISKCLHDS